MGLLVPALGDRVPDLSSTWSLAKLAEQLVKQQVVPTVSRETLRRILREGKVSWKTTTTWKSSNDLDFIAKLRRVLALYVAPADRRARVCGDEFGPLNLMPRKGKAWGPVRSPRRLLRRTTGAAG